MGKAGKKKKKSGLLSWVLRSVAKFIFVLVILTFLQVAVVRFINPPFTMSTAILTLKNNFFSSKDIAPKGEWRSIKDISPFLVRAVLAAEDQRFMSHGGFDLRELNRAVMDIIKERKIRGASTITMQMARTVFLWHDRSILRKITEAYYTVLIEFIMPKIRILEIYLNMVDWGNGIIGAEAASKKYFNKSASELTESQAALLAAVLPSPHRWSPANPNKQVIARQKRILRDMKKMHL